jgi:ferredoxin
VKPYVYLKNVVTLALDRERCIGCGMCLVVCPHGVLHVTDGQAQVQVGDRDACMECGACAMNCPTGAVTVSAGVGCAAAVINSLMGRESSSCCCVIEPAKPTAYATTDPSGRTSGTGCC